MSDVPATTQYDGFSPEDLPQLSGVVRRPGFVLILLALLPLTPSLWAISSEQPVDASSLPDAPNPPSLAFSLAPPPVSDGPNPLVGDVGIVSPANVSGTASRLNWYQRFTMGPRPKSFTPRDKAWLAARNLFDPVNLIAITGEAGISVAADSHSPYGPGISGYGRYVGVSFNEDLTGEFLGTFVIPSIAHQDPHYYRLEHAPVPRRIGHAIAQVFWTRGDSGKGMPNYANLVGFASDDTIANLYVPGRESTLGATADRYAIDVATAPIANFVNEFLPDVADHIHVQIVIIQRIINQVANTPPGGSL
jgi:hypothetical protein